MRTLCKTTGSLTSLIISALDSTYHAAACPLAFEDVPSDIDLNVGNNDPFRIRCLRLEYVYMRNLQPAP